MEGSYSGKLHVWGGWTAAVQNLPAPLTEFARFSREERGPSDHELYLQEALRPAGSAPRSEGAEPYSLQWFLDVESQRYGRTGKWIPKLLELNKHAGETLLGLGPGLGTDWLQYARHGAEVIVCNPSTHQLTLARRNFELRGLGGRFVHAVPHSLPLENDTIDVVCVTSLLHEVAEPRAVVDEVYRVLKPGGKVLAAVPAKYDLDYWYHTCFPWVRWLEGRPARPKAGPSPYSGRRLCRLFGRFVEHRVQKRHLRRAEVPHVWRWLPPGALQRLMGRVLVLKAFKPLSVALPVQAAA